MQQHKYLSGVTTLKFEQEKCIGCGLCLAVCPHGVFKLANNLAEIIDLDRCMECGACVRNCPVAALQVKAGVGCASAIIHGWLTGKEPSCDCSGGGTCC
jgi:NAD-dependent dihydropyrimidine dehydrogenase PreA subunit